MGEYRTIVADPPWHYERFVTQARNPGKWTGEAVVKPLPYASMTLKEIRAVPVNDLADADCRLFLWATNRYLPDAFGVLAAWGFEYKQTMVWSKTNGNMGGSIAPNAEFLLVAVKGSPPRLSKLKSAVVAAPIGRKHSAKPEVFQDHIEAISPGPYLELFARRERLGWRTWGNQSANSAGLDLAAA